MNGVARTSLWIAAVRAVETEREDAWFQDPFARELAGDDGFEILRASQSAGGARAPSLEVRTRFFDEQLIAAASAGLGQVVILASGMDARAYRLGWPESTRLFEIDQADVLAYKQTKLARARPLCTRHEIAVDLREDWPAALLAHGFDAAAPTLWLLEGLLHYLPPADVTRLFEHVDALSRPRSVALFDLVGRSLLASPFVKPLLEGVAKLGAPWQFGTDEPEELLAPRGWDVVVHDIAVVGHRYGRWPFPAMPRGTPGIPQSFLVEATKR
jgi:methyltransferase (TIGR00027 family)